MTTGLAASRKTPGIYLAVILGGAGTSAGVAPKKLLIMGNKITTTITGAAPTLSVTAGTQAAASPIQIASADDAGTYFGRGSELHTMAIAAFAQYSDCNLYAVAVAESAGTAASLVATFATNASAAYTVRIYACGQVLDVAVASGDTPTVIATAVCTAINAGDTLPFTAQFSTGAVTLTAKNLGPRGNTLTCAFSFITAAGIEVVITSSNTSSGAGTTCTLSGGSQVDGEYFFTSGATQDSFAAAITSISPTKYDRIACACIDATNTDLVVAHLNSLAGVTTQKRQQGLVGSIASLATSTTFATGRNAARLQVVWHYNSRLPIWDCTAQVAAARLIGDGSLGGSLNGEADDPAANLDGVQLATVRAQSTVADQPASTEIESALNNGLTPIVPSAARPGFCAVARSITSRSTANGVQNYAVLDTSQVTVPDYVADDLQSALATDYAGFKIAADSGDGLPPRAPRVTQPSLIRSNIARRLKVYEESAILTDVDANMSMLTVTLSSTTPGRVDCTIPCEPIPGLHVLGGDVRQLT
jgi:phage tail sheath gpL-like